MIDSPPNMYPDDLDRHIQAALDTDAAADQVARLEAFWHGRVRTQRRRRRLVAAGTVLGATLAAFAFIVQHREPGPDNVCRVESHRPDEQQPVPATSPQDETPEGLVVESETPAPAKAPTVRAATTYERFILAAKASPRREGTSTADAVTALLEKLAANPNADAAKLVRTSRRNQIALERELLSRLENPNDNETRPACRLLAACGTNQSLPALLRLAQRAEFRDDALDAIQQIGGTPAFQELATGATTPGLRAALCRRILLSGETISPDLCAMVIHNRNLRTELACDVSEELRTSLLLCLGHEDKPVRLAAALVLAEANDSAISEDLIRWVTDPEKPLGRDEAWIALCRRSDATAQRFRQFALQAPRLLGPLYRAQGWWLVYGRQG